MMIRASEPPMKERRSELTVVAFRGADDFSEMETS